MTMTKSMTGPAVHLGMNERPVRSMPESAWERPQKAPSSAFEQPWDQALAADKSLRDGEWTTGDHKDVWALSACALAFAALAFALAALIS